MIELLELSQVLKAVESTGTEVRYYDQACDSEGMAGFYEFGPNVDRLVVCTRNQLNHSDLFDTVRHEAIHVVQACYGGPLLPLERYIEDASHATHAAVADYPKDHKHIEYEAWHLAEVLHEDDVVKLIDKFCFE